MLVHFPVLGRLPAERRSRHAGLSELLWHHADARAYLSENGEWWPVEVGLVFCRGKKRNAAMRLADAETLDTAQDVEVYVLEVQRQRQSGSSAGRGQLTPAHWTSVMHLPVADAVAALIALELPQKLTTEDVNVGNYGWHRRNFGRVYHVTLPDLRSQPAKRMAERAEHGVAPVKRPAPVTFDGLKQAGFRLNVLPAGGPRPEWAGGLVLVARRAMGAEQVAEATEAALKCTYNILENQEGKRRLLSGRCYGSPSLPALRRLAEQHLGGGGVTIEVPWLAHLLTMPGCKRQRRHRDHRNRRVWSIIVALGLNPRVVKFRIGGREIPVRIAPGDAVIFRGDVCHFGGASATECACVDAEASCRCVGSAVSVNPDCVELAMHAYIITTQAGDDAFDGGTLGEEVPPCDGAGEDSE